MGTGISEIEPEGWKLETHREMIQDSQQGEKKGFSDERSHTGISW